MKTTTGKIGKIVLISVFLVNSFLFFAPAGRAEAKDWQKELTQDLVKVSKGKMTITEYQVCKVGDSSLQIKTYSEAPTGIISRDNFVALTAVYEVELSQKLGDLKCKDIDAPIGNVDVEMLFYMTKQGIKMELQDHRTSTKSSETVLWSDVFSNE